jgi:ABC-2 type transport system permease protein
MSAITTASGPGTQQRLKVTMTRVTRSEWIKLWSLRSTAWLLVSSAVIIVGVGVGLCAVALHNLEHGTGLGNVHPATISLYGAYGAQLTVGVLGVLLASGEYGTGMIRSTLTAVPARLPVLWAKLAVFAAIALVVSEAAVFTSLWVGQAILSSRDSGQSLADPGVLRAVVGTGLYLTLAGLLGVALGFVIRNTAGALATLMGLLLVLPLLGGALLPASWHVAQYLPSNAGQAVMLLSHASEYLAPWTGLGVFAAYTVATIGVAALVLARRDA